MKVSTKIAAIMLLSGLCVNLNAAEYSGENLIMRIGKGSYTKDEIIDEFVSGTYCGERKQTQIGNKLVEIYFIPDQARDVSMLPTSKQQWLEPLVQDILIKQGVGDALKEIEASSGSMTAGGLHTYLTEGAAGRSYLIDTGNLIPKVIAGIESDPAVVEALKVNLPSAGPVYVSEAEFNVEKDSVNAMYEIGQKGWFDPNEPLLLAWLKLPNPEGETYTDPQIAQILESVAVKGQLGLNKAKYVAAVNAKLSESVVKMAVQNMAELYTYLKATALPAGVVAARKLSDEEIGFILLDEEVQDKVLENNKASIITQTVAHIKVAKLTQADQVFAYLIQKPLDLTAYQANLVVEYSEIKAAIVAEEAKLALPATPKEIDLLDEALAMAGCLLTLVTTGPIA